MISWSEIEAECGNYREGFVAVFRKYEGQPTDEKDAQGRTVKVTVKSFSRHAGIPDSTFRGWVRSAGAALLPDPVRFAETRDVSGAKKVLADAPLEQVEQIVSALPADRKRELAKSISAMHPALETKPPMGIMDSIREHEKNVGLFGMMSGPLARLSRATEEVKETWDEHEKNASDEDKQLVAEEVRDSVATLLGIVSDPQELLT